MKKIFVCAILLCSIAVLAAEFVFADNGKAFYTIVVPEKTSGFEEQSAKDLQYFFSKMSGAEFKIVKESAAPAKNAIYIGKTNFARKADVNADKILHKNTFNSKISLKSISYLSGANKFQVPIESINKSV